MYILHRIEHVVHRYRLSFQFLE
uniref:Uncharacterized protein n=1 Tax=Rhizophora mucronata TaxID=61149 RepID=A0A2P2PFU7_RHIMU